MQSQTAPAQLPDLLRFAQVVNNLGVLTVKLENDAGLGTLRVQRPTAPGCPFGGLNPRGATLGGLILWAPFLILCMLDLQILSIGKILSHEISRAKKIF